VEFNKKLETLKFVAVVMGIILISNNISNLEFLAQMFIGLLAVTGIFIPLVVKKEIKEKEARFITERWKHQKKEFTGLVKDIKHELGAKAKDIDYDLIKQLSEELSNLSESMSAYACDINKTTKRAIVGLFIGLIAVVLSISLDTDVFIPGQGETVLIYYSLISMLALSFGLYSLAKIIVIWFELSEDN